MKISVITQHTVNNYGSVLQTYATQKILEQLGNQVEFVDYWRVSNLPETRAKALLDTNARLQRLKPLWSGTAWTRYAAQKAVEKLLARNRKKLTDFMQTHVTLTDTTYTSFEMLKENPPQADVYVTGSDQVWNSQHNDGLELPYYLAYAPEGKKRIALAASIGKTTLDPGEIPEMKALLESYSAISVREKSGAELLDSMGIPSQQILDPTLILDAAWWRKLADHRKCPAKPYMLIYQLNRNREMDAYADRLARKMGWELIRIGYHRSDKKRTGRCVYRPSVEEFLGLFDRAACCLTDSFHATAFSLNFGIDFISVAPPRFSTRIESILELTGTQNRLLTSFGDAEIQNSPIQKEQVAKRLEAERRKAWRFLENALSDQKSREL